MDYGWGLWLLSLVVGEPTWGEKSYSLKKNQQGNETMVIQKLYILNK